MTQTTYTTTPTDTMTFLATGGDDAPDITDERMAPGDGPPLHKHPWATWEVVIEGRLRVVVDGVDSEVGPGELIYTPPDSVHTFTVIGDGPARVIGFHWPGNFHAMYAAVAQAFPSDGPPDFGALAAAAAAHDAEILGPPLSALQP